MTTVETSSRAPVVIVGAGNVGRALGANIAALGHPVTFALRSSRDAVLPGTQTTPVETAADVASLVVLAVPFDAAAEVVNRLGLRPGTVLVDATNPFGRQLPDGLRSGAELIQQRAGNDVHVVKAFNVLGAEHMAHPPLPDGSRPVLPVAADDAEARTRVADLARELGFDPVEIGGLEHAGLLEEAARYWGLLAYQGGRGRGVVLVAHQR